MALTRTKRSNAGNRLQSLLANQAPLDEEDAKFFAEKDDDDDFDLEAEEERMRRERQAVNDESSDTEAGGRDGNHAQGEAADGEDVDEDDDEGDESAGDSNFSDTTDDSELENDTEPVDAGEKELEQEQRQRNREKRIAERNKIFTIKRRPPPPSELPEGAQPPRPKKKRIFTSADLISEKGRKSERKSAMRNKQLLIEQMKAAEERRAQYVPPSRTRAPKLTQEQRLEEAKKTEIRNLSTLNKFVELEEERKIQQRLAMISRRPKLTHFVRFHSTQYLAPPKLIEIIEHKDEAGEDDKEVKEETPTNPGRHNTGMAGVTGSEPVPRNEKTIEPTSEAKNEPRTDRPNDSAAVLNNGHNSAPNQDHNKNKETNNAAGNENTKEPMSLSDHATEVSNNSKETAVSEIKEEDTEVKEELGNAQEDQELPPAEIVEGPAHLRSYNFLTLHEFHDVHLNKFSIRNIILGSVASTSTQPPLKRMCPFSGKTAKYVDPKTDVAYTGLDTVKFLKLAQQNKLGWSKELGGVLTQGAVPQRPAKGVPDGF